MAVFLSKESKWSNKLVDETFDDPLLQPELRNVIMVKVDQADSKSVIKKWKINYFPSILFINDEGDILYQIKGYQSPQALADLITDLNLALLQNAELKDRIRWFYNLEEEKSFAVLQNKEMQHYECCYCGFSGEYNHSCQEYFKTLKIELCGGSVFPSRKAASAAIFEYIEVFYNRERLHSASGFLTSGEFHSSILFQFRRQICFKRYAALFIQTIRKIRR